MYNFVLGVGAGMMTNSMSTTSMPSSIAVSPAAAGAQVAVNNLTSIANVTMSEIVSAVTTGSTTPQSNSRCCGVYSVRLTSFSHKAPAFDVPHFFLLRLY